MAVNSVPRSFNPSPFMIRPVGRRVEERRAEETIFEEKVVRDIGARIAEQKLAAIDGEVRAHEAAHLAAAGSAAGSGASFDYVIGPNGERYAVGGSVRVMAQPIYGDPEATIRRAEALIRAAYAVSLPSTADLRVAAEAYQMEMDAKRELADKAAEKTGGMGVLFGAARGWAA